jgi:hypothetical protein
VPAHPARPAQDFGPNGRNARWFSDLKCREGDNSEGKGGASMRTLASTLFATAALVGGITLASAQSGSPTAPSGPMAGGGSASNATQGVGGTQRIETTGQATTTKKGAKAAPKSQCPRGQEAPLSRQDQGPGAPARRGAEFCFELAKSLTRAPACPRYIGGGKTRLHPIDSDDARSLRCSRCASVAAHGACAAAGNASDRVSQQVFLLSLVVPRETGYARSIACSRI